MEGFALVFVTLAFVTFPTDAANKFHSLCEGNDLSKWVKCQDNHVLYIVQAEYGRTSEIMCEGVNSTVMCKPPKRVDDVIRSVCEGKQKCDSFIVNRENLGKMEMCKHVNIYLKLITDCIKTEEPKDGEPEGPKVQEKSKNGARFIATQDDRKTNHVQFKQLFNGSSWTQSVELIVLFLPMMAFFCSFY